ncbi:(3,5-dihydroxyphenyl)acetyl-CoA 1,2-dioxygenase DpgC [Streptomyces lavendulae]|uniref:(3,5-dihydroxyphenyl)acetyl-CoA 1,2-dioxygenase DpgC n=1 Tax=Streptomyces lavendulae TaxID=1914 RepID=UPI00369B2AD0
MTLPDPARAADPPAPSGDLAADAAALAALCADGERLLAALPAPADRDEAASRRAARVHESCRDARHAFLHHHAETVYDLLTDRRTRRPRLAELARTAAVRFPGLVPGPDLLAQEAGRLQAHKEGREIDQGIFFGAVLRSPRAGTHLIETMLGPAPGSAALLDGFRRTGTVDLPTVRLERRGPAAHLTFHNGHCLNAEDNRLIADLETAVDLALLDDTVHVGVLRGGPVTHSRHAGRRVFSAGINLKDLHAGAISYVDFLLGRELGYVHKIARGLLTGAPGWRGPLVSKPWIAAVDAFAIGGGMQLLLVADRVIAAEGALLALPAADEGIVPGLANLRLPRLTGARTARQIVLCGRRLTAGEPDAALVCDETVPAGEVGAAVERAVGELAAPAVAANRRMLALAQEPLDVFRAHLAEFAVVQAARIHSPDVLAKVERRRSRTGAGT